MKQVKEDPAEERRGWMVPMRNGKTHFKQEVKK